MPPRLAPAAAGAAGRKLRRRRNYRRGALLCRPEPAGSPYVRAGDGTRHGAGETEEMARARRPSLCFCPSRGAIELAGGGHAARRSGRGFRRRRGRGFGCRRGRLMGRFGGGRRGGALRAAAFFAADAGGGRPRFAAPVLRGRAAFAAARGRGPFGGFSAGARQRRDFGATGRAGGRSLSGGALFGGAFGAQLVDARGGGDEVVPYERGEGAAKDGP